MSLLSRILGEGEPEAPPRPVVNKVNSVQTIVYRGSGTKHRDFCHDFLVHHETNDFFVGVVMDGCTGSIHPQFPSALFGKIFNLLLRSQKTVDRYGADTEPITIANELMYRFCQNLLMVKNILEMAQDELFSTILLEVYSKKKDKLFVVAFGDGYVHLNGKGHKVENTKYGDSIDDGVVKEGRNKPNYLIYDIEKVMVEEDLPYPEFGNERGAQERNQKIAEWRSVFDQWFLEQPAYEFNDVHDFSIATDGIYTFRCGKEDVTDQVIELLLDRKTGYGGTSRETPRKKMNVISFRNKPGEVPHPDKLHAMNDDDVSFIRVIIDKE